MTKELEKLMKRFVKRRRLIIRKYPYALNYVFETSSAIIDIELEAFCRVLRYWANVKDFVKLLTELGLIHDFLRDMDFTIRRIDNSLSKILSVISRSFYGVKSIEISSGLLIRNGRIIDERQGIKHYIVFEGLPRQTLIIKEKDALSITLESPYVPMLTQTYIQEFQSALPKLRSEVLGRLL